MPQPANDPLKCPGCKHYNALVGVWGTARYLYECRDCKRCYTYVSALSKFVPTTR